MSTGAIGGGELGGVGGAGGGGGGDDGGCGATSHVQVGLDCAGAPNSLRPAFPLHTHSKLDAHAGPSAVHTLPSAKPLSFRLRLRAAVLLFLCCASPNVQSRRTINQPRRLIRMCSPRDGSSMMKEDSTATSSHSGPSTASASATGQSTKLSAIAVSALRWLLTTFGVKRCLKVSLRVS